MARAALAGAAARPAPRRPPGRRAAGRAQLPHPAARGPRPRPVARVRRPGTGRWPPTRRAVAPSHRPAAGSAEVRPGRERRSSSSAATATWRSSRTCAGDAGWSRCSGRVASARRSWPAGPPAGSRSARAWPWPWWSWRRCAPRPASSPPSPPSSACRPSRAARCRSRCSSCWRPARCCSCSTTASTCSTPSPRSSSGCSPRVRRSRCWPPAASRWVCRRRPCTRCRRCRSPTPMPIGGRRGLAGRGAVPAAGGGRQPAPDRRRGDRSRAVAELCRRLDGVPLAIELAAARTRALSPAEITERLDDRFGLLAGSSRVADERHRSLRTLVDWSYQLLDPAAQELFRRLSTFAGAFDLDAAERVCGYGDLPRSAVATVLASLVDKSMVQAFAGDRTTYRLLETLREYGAGLAQPEAAELARRHGAWLVEVCERGAVGPARRRRAALARHVRAALRRPAAGRPQRPRDRRRSPPRCASSSPLASTPSAACATSSSVGRSRRSPPPSLPTSRWPRPPSASWPTAGSSAARSTPPSTLAQRSLAVAAESGTDTLGMADRALGNACFFHGDMAGTLAAVARQLDDALASGDDARVAHAYYMALARRDADRRHRRRHALRGAGRWRRPGAATTPRRPRRRPTRSASGPPPPHRGRAREQLQHSEDARPRSREPVVRALRPHRDAVAARPRRRVAAGPRRLRRRPRGVAPSRRLGQPVALPPPRVRHLLPGRRRRARHGHPRRPRARRRRGRLPVRTDRRRRARPHGRRAAAPARRPGDRARAAGADRHDLGGHRPHRGPHQGTRRGRADHRLRSAPSPPTPASAACTICAACARVSGAMRSR